MLRLAVRISTVLYFLLSGWVRLSGQELVYYRYSQRLPYEAYGWMVRACPDSVRGDSAAIGEVLGRCVQAIRSAGFLEASVDSVRWLGRDTLWVGLHMGFRYRVSQVSVSGDSAGQLANLGQSEAFTTGKARELAALVSHRHQSRGSSGGVVQVGAYLGDTAGGVRLSFWLDSMVSGPLVSVRSTGSLRMRPGVLMRVLGLRLGDQVGLGDLPRLSRYLRSLPSARQTGRLGLEWEGEGVVLQVALARRASSVLSGHVGMSPRGGSRGGYSLTGHFRALLHGMLGHAEELEFAWRGLGQGVYSVRSGVDWPYLFGSRFGVQGSVRLRRSAGGQGMLDFRIALPYSLSPRSRVHVGHQHLATKGGGDAVGEIQTRAQLAHLGYSHQAVDYSMGWRDGWGMLLEWGMGQRSVHPVRGMMQRGAAMRYHAGAWYQKPLWEWGFTMGVRGLASGYDLLSGGGELGDEEFIRYGGMGSMRGFHEEQLRASHYVVVSVEPGWQLGDWVRMSLLLDGSWFSIGASHDWLFGYGGLLSVQVGVGEFRLGMARGVSARGLVQAPGGALGLVHIDLGVRF